MKKNKKLLILFLSLNSILTSHADTINDVAPVNKTYSRTYSNITNNLQTGVVPAKERPGAI